MNKTKRKIFETSMKLFAEKGYDATSIEESRMEANFVLNQLSHCTNLRVGVWYDMEDADNYKANRGSLVGSLMTNMCNTFCSILQNAGYYTGVYSSSSWFNYYLYDMNKDGIPELFIVSGDSEATKEISVYTYTDNPNLKYADDIVNVGIFGCGHGNIYLSNDGQLVIFFAHMGYQHYTYYKLENDWLVRTYYSGDEYIEAGNEYRPPENVKEMITIPSSDLSLFDNYK